MDESNEYPIVQGTSLDDYMLRQMEDLEKEVSEISERDSEDVEKERDQKNYEKLIRDYRANMNEASINFFMYLCKPTVLTSNTYEIPGVSRDIKIFQSDQELIGKITLFIFYLVLVYGAKSYGDLINKLKSPTKELYIIYKICKLAFRRMAKLIDEIKNIFNKCVFEELTNENLAEIYLEQIKDLLKVVEKANIKTGGPGGLVISFDMGIINQLITFSAAINFNFSQVFDLYNPILKRYITYQFENYNDISIEYDSKSIDKQHLGMKELLKTNNLRYAADPDNPRIISEKYTHWHFAKFKDWYKDPQVKDFFQIIRNEALLDGNIVNKAQSYLANKLSAATSAVGKTASSTGKAIVRVASFGRRGQPKSGVGGKKTRRKCKKKRKTKKRKIKKNKKTKKN
jgi:hypothetical protein